MTQIAVIDKQNLRSTLKLLEQEVGPRRYWLHNKIGGVKWSMENQKDGYHLRIDDQSTAIWILLKLRTNA